MTSQYKPASPAAEANPIAVVGIGASAGGLEALEQFFSHLPADSGFACVVVQHLDPDKDSALVPLLQRVSLVPVVQIKDRTPLARDHVYIAPPGFEVSILHGVLHLLKPPASQGPGLPIDSFFRSLALDQQIRAAGVVLSGMGSDGTLGARALKEKAGIVLAQSPESARFSAMPRSVIDASLADIVASPGQLPQRIGAYFTHLMRTGDIADDEAEPRAESLHSMLEKVLILVRNQTGHDFSLYKKGTVYRRIQRRMAIHQIDTADAYVRHIQDNAFEADLLHKELLIGVTCFFRDPQVWQQLRQEVFPRLIQDSPAGSALRAWVAACSTGEEAFTLAMVFAEAAAEFGNPHGVTLQIFATDLEEDSVASARKGFYPENISADVSPERLDRFFTAVAGGYRVKQDIRSMVVFAQQSIASDPPFARLDILTCRNLLIYLEPELQQKLLPLFHRSLNPGGILVLGTAETIGQSSDLFTPLGAKTRIYRRLDVSTRPANLPPYPELLMPTPAHSASPRQPSPGTGSLQVLADQVLARKYAPAAVLVSAQGDIVYFSGKTGKYLEPAAGKANLNLFAMARAGLSQPLSEVFYRALRQKAAAVLDPVTVDVDGKPLAFAVTVEPLNAPESLQGLVLVVFADVPLPFARPASAGADSEAGTDHERQVSDLLRELARSREEHQATRNEMQAAQESLMSANGELQSANEELTTSCEEMQSINEELQTVNAELQARVDALARASDDMENLLNATDIATVFLDQRLNVRRFTTRSRGLFKLIAGDVGRPITDIVSEMDYPDLASDAREVLRTLMFQEKEVTASGDRWFMVRTMPYRTQDNRIDGVVITFTDISVAKRLEASLRKAGAGTAQAKATQAKPASRRSTKKSGQAGPGEQGTQDGGED
ncbi:chemotaxis protein CheB [Polaromonas aquatica]|uniref:chemotaxis protein CheB n=1 Tax=Polaromonas aquatica TaxID=332657 RepID=UPI003D65F4CB